MSHWLVKYVCCSLVEIIKKYKLYENSRNLSRWLYIRKLRKNKDIVSQLKKLYLHRAFNLKGFHCIGSVGRDSWNAMISLILSYKINFINFKILSILSDKNDIFKVFWVCTCFLVLFWCFQSLVRQWNSLLSHHLMRKGQGTGEKVAGNRTFLSAPHLREPPCQARESKLEEGAGRNLVGLQACGWRRGL